MNRNILREEELPRGWRKMRLGKVSQFSKGNGITKAEVIAEGVPCVRYGELYTKHNFKINNFYSFISDKNSGNHKLIKYNDLLFAGSGETREEIGKCASFYHNIKAYAGGDVIICSIDPRILRADFASYYLNTIGRRQINKLGQGDSIVHIYSRYLEDVEISVPPLSEQKAIASLLETWDTATKKVEDLIATKEKYFKWLLKTLIGDKQNHPEWRKVILGEIGVIHSGGTPSTRDKRNWNGDISWLTPSEVTKLSDKYINSTERRITQKGLSSTTLLPENCLIVCTRATIGDCCINTVPMAINQGFKCIQPTKHYSVTFLYYAFQLLRAKLVRLSCGNTFGEVSKKDFANILISVPSLLEQRNIAALLNAAQRETTVLKQLTEQYHTQKRGLMQKLLTGKLKINT